MLYPAKSISPHLLDKRRKINVFMDAIAIYSTQNQLQASRSP
jgi:hypothetical protein